ncbi:MAG: hypothetical protein JWN25_463 [Verrucomicrobiales bacterium]|nr:hypothetical protein [Verrucomicrobiales bacterium]
MEIPKEVAVMTLPNATLFPQALLPLYIYEPRYRRMLVDALQTHRTFAVAMQKPGRLRETPSLIGGVGLIRVAVQNEDGTYHLILQGLTRVTLTRTVRYKPYRIHEVQPVETPANDSLAVDALVARVRDLVSQRVQLGFPKKGPAPKQTKDMMISIKEVLSYIEKISDPEQVADLVSCALLPRAEERQTILETIDIEPRLKHLIHFLMAEIGQQRKDKSK